MNRSSARLVCGAALLGLAALSLAFWKINLHRQRDSAVPASDPPAKEKTAGQVAGWGDVLYAIMNLEQDALSPVQIVSKDSRIALRHTGAFTYEGRLDLAIRCESDVLLTLSMASIRPVGVTGSYSCAIAPHEVAAPGGNVTAWVTIRNTVVRDTPRGGEVATVRLRAVRRQDTPAQWLTTGFGLYDAQRYEEALLAFERMELAGGQDPNSRAAALIWQGHVLDLLGWREEALWKYREVVDMRLDAGVHHDEYGLSYRYTPYATERIYTPFTRVERLTGR